MSNIAFAITGLACLALLAWGLSSSVDGTDQTSYDQGTDPAQDPVQETLEDQPLDLIETPFIDLVLNRVKTAVGLWHPPAKYASAIATAEQANGIPADLLARLLWQECHYREEIINGTIASPAGALGIAQFMPATARDEGIDPLDPFQAIQAAARYLARLKRQTGTWTKALAAYNWGIGNVQRKGLDQAPTETRNYFTEILADVNSSTGQNLA